MPAKRKRTVNLAAWLKSSKAKTSDRRVVYEVGPRSAPEERFRSLMSKVELEGETQETEDLLLASKGSRLMALYRPSSAFWHVDLSKLRHPDYSAKLPARTEATKRAQSYLRATQPPPEGARLARAEPLIFERETGKRRTRSKSSNSLCLTYQWPLNGLKVIGPGAKSKVYLGQRGEVIGAHHAAQPHHPYAESPARSREELAAILERKLRMPLREVELRDVELGYYAESPTLRSRFTQPVYIFTLATRARSKRQRTAVPLEFETHPIPATSFAPVVLVDSPRPVIEVRQEEPLEVSCDVLGGEAPFKFQWESNVDGLLGEERSLSVGKLSIAHRAGQLLSHTLKVTVTDAHGLSDSHHVRVRVLPRSGKVSGKTRKPRDIPGDPYCGVEWCNDYSDSGLGNISGTDDSARGFKNHIAGLSNWSSRFDWGDDAAWEQDFKHAGAPGGGTDSYWADNVHFAFFAGHGSSGNFWFNSSVDDHQMRAQDARWGDGILNWVVLHACQTMRNNFAWDVWCDAFQGLHEMFGFHTNTEGSTPPLGSRFAFWSSFSLLPWWDALNLRTAWAVACSECFGSSREYAVIYAGQSGTDTHNDHLHGFGHVSADPTSPWYWVYYKDAC